MKKAMLVAIAVLATLGSVAQADLEEITSMFDIEINLDYYSHYIWRGQEITESVFQGEYVISYEGLGLAFWTNRDLTNERGRQFDTTELDYTLFYEGACPWVEGVNWEAGMIYYNFSQYGIDHRDGRTTIHDTAEFYWGFSFDAPYNPGFTIYHDFDEADGTYASFAISHTWEDVAAITEESSMDLVFDASLGWGSSGYNSYYWGVSDGAFNDLNFSLSMPFDMMGWTLQPSINWTMVVDNKLRDTNQKAYATGYDDANNYFYIGFGASRAF